jgi:chromosome segregation ATPase
MERKRKSEKVTIEALEAQLKAWRNDLEKLGAKAAAAIGEAKTGLDREVAELRTMINEGQIKLERQRNTGKGASKELLKEIGKAYAKLRKGIRKSASR